MNDTKSAEALADELDKRVVTRWVHATGQTPHASGHSPDKMCREAAALIRTQSARIAALEAAAHTARDALSTMLTDGPVVHAEALRRLDAVLGEPRARAVAPPPPRGAREPKRCEACRATGAIHCHDPENCGGPWDKRHDDITGGKHAG